MPQRAMFKILTCILVVTGSILPVYSETISQETFKTHLRWSLNTGKEGIMIDKKGNSLFLRTLDAGLFSSLAQDLTKVGLDKSYFKSVDYKEGSNGSPSEVKVELKDDSVELFTFYKDKENKHIMDFWINQDLVVTKKAAIQKDPQVKKVAPVKTKPVQKKVVKAVPRLDKEMSVLDPSKVAENKKTGYRDFRYGAAFVWDYEAFIPPLESDINLSVKGPDAFYSLEDRAFEQGDEKESHMQLSINFFRKQKWGLMTKSLELYEKRYGNDSNKDFNDFMKAVSLIKNTINPKVETKLEAPKTVEGKNGELVQIEPTIRASDKGILSAGISILQNIVDRTENYELKKACMRYILQSNLSDQDYVRALQMAKQLYVSATERFDDEMIIRSSRAILYSLAHLKQTKKMEEFLQNKAVIRVLPAQEGDAYISFVNLFNGDKAQVLSRFSANKKSYAKPVHPAILFNTAESYFRGAEYEKAIQLFDEFIADYSYFDVAGFARLRVALAYDLLDNDPKKVLKLYEGAINKSTNAKARFEAKTRYVGLRVARKLDLDESDLETISFLEATPVEKKAQDQNLKKLLWLTRLRTLVSKGDYEAALAYLASVPLDGLRLVERRAFTGDGAEIVLGLVKDAYLKEDYARAVKVWEVFKDKYEEKVAKNPYLNFIVSDSFLKLGLTQSFDRSLASLEKLEESRTRVFPRWVTSHKKINAKDYINELKLTKMVQGGEWDKADAFLNGLKDRGEINYNYYKGIVSYNLKKYNESTKLFEELLVKPNARNALSPRQSLNMLTAYSESLYQGADQARFRKNTAALLNDLRRSGAAKNRKAIERLEYLYIESLNGEKKADYALVERKAKEFTAEHKESVYGDRVKYLRGVALINVSNQDEGKQLLEELINGDKTPEYIKGLARSELSSLALKNKTL